MSEDWLPSKHDALKEPIVFYDGVCGLCQKGVQLILAEDVRGRMQLAPLQGETSTKLLNLPETDQYDTMILHEDGALFERSEAALRIAEILGGFWRLTAVLQWLPQETRDRLYDLVAENRYEWFGKLDACPVPSPEQRARFMD
jgi:predicted DCC family thiol-disulfide oxidoreductase YuxK